MQPYSYKSMVQEAEASLVLSGKDQGIAMLLLEDLFDISRADFLLDGDEPVRDDEHMRYRAVIDDVMSGVPYQYAIGFAWFFGEKFKVDTHTLIPRNETEELVEHILNSETDDGRTVVDIGTGTGNIGLILQNSWQNNEVVLTDISTEALSVAMYNAEQFGISPLMLAGNMYAPLIDRGLKADVIVSNPPYIGYNETDEMDVSVLRHEPYEALFASDDGLGFYKEMIDGLPEVLNFGGAVYFEIGWQQFQPLQQYISAKWPNTRPHLKKDINGNDRILFFRWED